MLYGWTPRIGDPSLIGWATVFFYLSTALLSWRAAASAQEAGDIPFWKFLCVLFLALGFNKQLDLQSLLTAALREAARNEGWYAVRYRFQIAFVATVTLTGLSAIAYLLWRHQYSSRAVKAAIAGCAFTLCFVIIRAASFHHIDRILGRSVGGWKLNWLLELGGIMLVAMAAAATRRRPMRNRSAS
jgi:hypothetical protein